MSSDHGPVGRVTDANGHSWRVGTDAEVAWIARGTSPGLAITAAIPPAFDAYATIVPAVDLTTLEDVFVVKHSK